ncbi:Uma2 family endonuclease [Clostridium perfringens]|uniref:Uma2 family endonuclease n=1 Tax=Clostridium perfringens TaxID=1502 RepID=UPI0018E451BA|nr:Uma2 family endonuclease [Clostridium perfringens]EIW6613653.1 Uma2 family endonuclease [Clostridium perfringens]
MRLFIHGFLFNNIIYIISKDNQEYMFDRFNNYLKQGVKEYWIISPKYRIFQVHTYDIINKTYVSFLQEPYKELRSRLFPDLVINME